MGGEGEEEEEEEEEEEGEKGRCGDKCFSKRTGDLRSDACGKKKCSGCSGCTDVLLQTTSRDDVGRIAMVVRSTDRNPPDLRWGNPPDLRWGNPPNPRWGNHPDLRW